MIKQLFSMLKLNLKLLENLIRIEIRAFQHTRIVILSFFVFPELLWNNLFGEK